MAPFIKNHYSTGDYVFWPDLASSHYGLQFQEYHKSRNINFVPKNINPANLPKSRPIKDFGGNLKEIVYEGDWNTKDLESLKNKIISCINKMDWSQMQLLGILWVTTKSSSESLPARIKKMKDERDFFPIDEMFDMIKNFIDLRGDDVVLQFKSF